MFQLIEMIVEIREIGLFTRATPGSSLVFNTQLHIYVYQNTYFALNLQELKRKRTETAKKCSNPQYQESFNFRY